MRLTYFVVDQVLFFVCSLKGEVKVHRHVYKHAIIYINGSKWRQNTSTLKFSKN